MRKCLLEIMFPNLVRIENNSFITHKGDLFVQEFMFAGISGCVYSHTVTTISCLLIWLLETAACFGAVVHHFVLLTHA